MDNSSDQGLTIAGRGRSAMPPRPASLSLTSKLRAQAAPASQGGERVDFSGHRLEILVEALGAEDPFAVAPVEIVERILAAGFTPVVDQPKEEPWRYIGTVSQVEHDGQTFLVAVSWDALEIGLQEMRAEPHATE